MAGSTGNIHRFLGLHFCVSAALVSALETEILGGWLIFALFAYAFAALVLPYLFGVVSSWWIEIRTQDRPASLLAGFLLLLLQLLFALSMDKTYRHTGTLLLISLLATVPVMLFFRFRKSERKTK